MKTTFILLLSLFSFQLFAQSSDSLTKELAKKQSKIDSLNSVISKISDELKLQKGTKISSDEIEKLRNDIFGMRTELDNTKYNLAASHRQFRTGTILKVAGIAAMVVGTFALSGATKSSDVLFPFALYFGGAISWTAGMFIALDSHKYIGVAGRKVKSSNK